MKIKMRTLASSAELGTLEAGKVYEISTEQAQPFLEGGYAVEVASVMPAQPVESSVLKTRRRGREKAVVNPSETAEDE